MAAKPAEAFDRSLLAELVRGAQLTFDNAEALFYEARLLGDSGAFSRSLFLHQISLEECAKIEIMSAWATSVLGGMPVDEKKVLAGMARHATKNRTNAYMIEGSPAEKAASQRGDWRAAIEEFKKSQADFHTKSNAEKNASLYVDFQGGKFVAPADQITSEMVAETAARNETFLSLMHPKVKLLLKWEKAPEDASESIKSFVELAESMKADKSFDPATALEKLLRQSLEEELARRAKNERQGQT